MPSKTGPLFMANPEVIEASDEDATYEEGCLSLPEHYSDVVRPAKVKVRYVDREGKEHALTLDDILVVAPYNAQVRCLRSRLPDGARIGTVDKFQGQEAPVVFFSMTSSSGEDVPRGMDFLFSRNRLNVAVSRAQAVAVVVCSPSLLWAPCNAVEQMTLVNALCTFTDDARRQRNDVDAPTCTGPRAESPRSSTRTTSRPTCRGATSRSTRWRSRSTRRS